MVRDSGEDENGEDENGELANAQLLINRSIHRSIDRVSQFNSDRIVNPTHKNDRQTKEAKHQTQTQKSKLLRQRRIFLPSLNRRRRRRRKTA